MYCKNCGANFPDGVFECPVCHTMIDEKRNQYNYGGGYEQYVNQSEGAPNNGAQYYAPPQQNNYQQTYTNDNWHYHDMQYRQMEEKGETARILAILGLVLGIILTPILGWILGGIGLSNAKEVYAYLRTPSAKTTITIAKWAIIVSSVLAALAAIAVIAWFAIVSAGVFAQDFYYNL